MLRGPDERSRPLRVLFLCTANSARSQIAEALLKHKGGDRFLAASAGLVPAARVHPAAVTALAAIHIDWSEARPKGLDAVSADEWDFIITTCDRSRESCPRFPGQPVYAHWGVPDPAVVEGAEQGKAFSDTVNLLAWRIDLMLALRRGLLERDAAEARLQRIGLTHPDSGGSRSPPETRQITG